MKTSLFVLTVALLFSCKSNDETKTQENWVLTQRKLFKYQLNATGLPDTSFVKLYKYQNLEIKDSVEAFTVSSYDEGRVASETSFIGSATSAPQLTSQARYTYLNDKYLTSVTQTTSGVLTKDEKYVYDTSGKLVSSVLIVMRDFDKISEQAGDKAIPKEKLLGQGYDTLTVSYKYDASNKNMGAEFVDNRGNLIRRDVNIYSGNSPIRSVNLGPKGDTLQRISYTQTGNVLQTQSDNDNFTILTATNSGFMTGKITVYKKEPKKIKQDWGYEMGRMTEERFYVDGGK